MYVRSITDQGGQPSTQHAVNTTLAAAVTSTVGVTPAAGPEPTYQPPEAAAAAVATAAVMPAVDDASDAEQPVPDCDERQHTHVSLAAATAKQTIEGLHLPVTSCSRHQQEGRHTCSLMVLSQQA